MENMGSGSTQKYDAIEKYVNTSEDAFLAKLDAMSGNFVDGKPLDDQVLTITKYSPPGSNMANVAMPRKKQAYIAYGTGENKSYLVVGLFGKRIPINSPAKPSVLPVSVDNIDNLLVAVESEITHRGLNCRDITHTTQDSRIGKTYEFPDASGKTIKELAILAYQMQSQYK